MVMPRLSSNLQEWQRTISYLQNRNASLGMMMAHKQEGRDGQRQLGTHIEKGGHTEVSTN